MKGVCNMKIDVVANEIATETIEYSKVLCNRYLDAYKHNRQVRRILEQSVINQLIFALIGKE